MTYILIGVVILIISGLFGTKPKHTYNAHFGNAWEHLSRFNHGFAVTGSKALTKKVSHENSALFGPTGSGKSTVVIISSAVSLSRGKSSIIFNDVDGEAWKYTSGYLKSKGYLILRFNFSNALYSETFNILLFCTTISDIQKVALIIIRNANGETKGEIFWEQSSIALLCLFMRYLVFFTEPQFRTIQNVLRLIEKFATDNDQVIDKLILATKDEDLIQSYKATLVVGEKTLQSIIVSTRVALNLWNDPEVCKTTATNSFDFSLLRKVPVAIYICNPLKDLMYLKPLSAIFFQSLFDFVLSRIPEKNERSIFFLMDEAATMKFPNLSTTISNIRKFKAGILLCMQDETALISRYGQAEAHQIKTNCGCQIYLKSQPLHTCKDLSQILGKYTLKDEKDIERTRELMTPDEIRMCDDAIILISNKAPLKCKTVPFYNNMWLQGPTKLPPYKLSEKDVSTPPLIQFEPK